MNSELRTFCHINDYDEQGYRNLHRLVAGSLPLVLWAPSSALFRSHGSIPVDYYLKLIEEGKIRIIGREEWLLDPAWRNSPSRWEGAAWDKKIDDAIYRIYINDLHVTDNRQKRVIVAHKEPGKKWAEDAIEAEPELVTFWRGILESPDADDRVPPGTLQAIRKGRLDPLSATTRILRDASNHGQAVVDSLAETPFLLSHADREFLKILDDARYADRSRPDATDLIPQQRLRSDDPTTDALTTQLLEILERLDDCRGEHSLRAFIQRGGQQELVNWLVEIKSEYAAGGVLNEGALARSLALKIRHSKRSGVRDLFDGFSATGLTAVGAGGLVNTAVQVIDDPSISNILGVAISALTLGTGALRMMGYVERSYNGPHWPYLYTYGKKANRDRRRKLIDNLGTAN
jgi:hypothetical protein